MVPNTPRLAWLPSGPYFEDYAGGPEHRQSDPEYSQDYLAIFQTTLEPGYTAGVDPYSVTTCNPSATTPTSWNS